MAPYHSNLTHWGRGKMAAILLTICSNVFLQWKSLNFDNNFTEVDPKDPVNNMPPLAPILAQRCTGADSLSEPMMANVTVVYASLSFNELMIGYITVQFICWCWNIVGELVQYQFCWWIGSLGGQVITWPPKEPGHQQPWYRVCRINWSVFSVRKDFNFLYQWLQIILLIYFYVFLKKKKKIST